MPLTSKHQAQISFFLNQLLFGYFDDSNDQEALADISKKQGEIDAIKDFVAKSSLTQTEIDDFKKLGSVADAQDSASLSDLRNFILCIKTKYLTYFEGFRQQLVKINCKFDEVITIQQLENYNLGEYLEEIFPDPAAEKPFPNFKYSEDHPKHEIETYWSRINKESPESSLISKSAIIDNHIIDQSVIDTIQAKDKWKFVYHRVNSSVDLDPRTPSVKDLWVVLAISPKNEVTCLDPNGISRDENVKNDIFQITQDAFKRARVPFSQSQVEIVEVKSNRFKEDSALSCSFAAEDLAKEIFIKNSAFNQRGESGDHSANKYSSRHERSVQYAKLTLQKDIIQEFSKVDLGKMTHTHDGGFSTLSSDVEIIDRLEQSQGLFNSSEEFRDLLTRIQKPESDDILAQDKVDLKEFQSKLIFELKEINAKLEKHKSNYTEFQSDDILDSNVKLDLKKLEGKAINAYNQDRYSDAKRTVLTSDYKVMTYDSLKNSLDRNLIRTYQEVNPVNQKNSDRMRYSGYFLDEKNNLHLVSQKNRQMFEDQTQMLTSEVADKIGSNKINYNEQQHSFAPYQDTKTGVKSIVFDDAKYKRDTMVYYYLGGIDGEKLNILQNEFKPMKLKEAESKIGDIKAIIGLRDKIKSETDITAKVVLEGELEVKRKEFKSNPKLTDKEIKSFLLFRKYEANAQAKPKFGPSKKDIADDLQSHIQKSDQQRDEIPSSIATNVAVKALVDMNLGKKYSAGRYDGR